MAEIINIQDRAGLPGEGQRTMRSFGKLTGESEARRIVEQHRRRLQARGFRDATAEKYALHVDGEGGTQ